METYLPLFKTIFADWVQLTSNEPLYAGALAFTAWLLTASLYSIRIAFLNKQSTARENARIDASKQLSAAQLQVQELQQQLSENTEQLKISQELAINETERAEKLEDQLKERNKQIAAIIQSFSTSFDLGERPLPLTEDLKAESLWQQFDRTIHLLITRLSNEQEAKAKLQASLQAETLKSTENAVTISTLQTGIAAQTIKIANLELLLEEQKNTLQQQQDHAQLVLEQSLLEQSLANKQAEAIHKQTQTQANADSINNQAVVNETLTATPAEIIVPVEPIIEPLATAIKTAVTELTVNDEITELPPIKSSNDQLGKLKNLFGKALKKTTSEITQDAAPVTPLSETLSTPIKTAPTESTVSPESTELPAIKSSNDQLGKLKNLFGKKSNNTTSTTPEIITDQQTDVLIEQPPIEIEPATVKPSKSPLKKMKYYFGEPKQSTETKPEVAKTPSAPVEIEPEPNSSAKFSFAKLKSIISKLP
jgi:hypothetical protein